MPKLTKNLKSENLEPHLSPGSWRPASTSPPNCAPRLRRAASPWPPGGALRRSLSLVGGVIPVTGGREGEERGRMAEVGEEEEREGARPSLRPRVEGRAALRRLWERPKVGARGEGREGVEPPLREGRGDGRGVSVLPSRAPALLPLLHLLTRNFILLMATRAWTAPRHLARGARPLGGVTASTGSPSPSPHSSTTR